VFVEIINCS